jgi:hypothetical protein
LEGKSNITHLTAADKTYFAKWLLRASSAKSWCMDAYLSRFFQAHCFFNPASNGISNFGVPAIVAQYPGNRSRQSRWITFVQTVLVSGSPQIL